MTPYISEQRARIAELQARADRLTLEDAQWLLDQLTRSDWNLEVLRDRIDDAGSMMNTTYVSSAIDYTRWSRGTPRGPVMANPQECARGRIGEAVAMFEPLLVCEECGQRSLEVKRVADPFTEALYPERDDHEQMTLCPSCIVARFEES
ncbi:hypothetical protein [Streptomyces sp. NPDC053720]|uniref:hypothetical protein n=1 Tax=Streptomyces sp. NPDC053720 TaxID=3154855 RepID=UPI0034351D85